MASKGTAAKGKKQTGRHHIRCRRCGEPAYQIRKKVCSSCGYGRTKRVRSFRWMKKKRGKHSYRSK